jgi:hypothetical protein
MEGIWARRLRWRLRGAWQWPLFLVLTLGDGVLLHELPIAGTDTGIEAGILLAAFFNLVAIAVLAPLAGIWLRRRRRDLPRSVASDYAGAALVIAITVTFVGAGLAHRPAVRAEHRAFAAQAAAVRGFVLAHAPAAFRANLDRADTLRLEPDRYRTCVPGPDPRRALCLLLDTARSPPGVRVDPNRAPNADFVGPVGR